MSSQLRDFKIMSAQAVGLFKRMCRLAWAVFGLERRLRLKRYQQKQFECLSIQNGYGSRRLTQVNLLDTYPFTLWNSREPSGEGKTKGSVSISKFQPSEHPYMQKLDLFISIPTTFMQIKTQNWVANLSDNKKFKQIQ